MKKLAYLLVVAAGLALPAAAKAQVLNFEGIVAPGQGSVAVPTDWYNGGPGGNFGITFSDNALAVCLQPAASCNSLGSRGGLGDPNSQLGALFFLDGAATYMNSSLGFTNGFSFFYTAINQPGSFTVYGGLNGTGAILATVNLPTTPFDGADGCGGEAFCPFVAAGVTFSGTAESVAFGGADNQIAFDDVTFGSATPDVDVSSTPEPASLALVGTGLIGLAGVTARRRKAKVS